MKEVNNFHRETDNQSKHNTTSELKQLLGALASITESTGRTGCEAKATEITVSTLLGKQMPPKARLI